MWGPVPAMRNVRFDETEFEAERKVVLRSDERRRRFRQALETILADAVHLGLTRAEVEQAIATALKRYRFGKGGKG